MKVTFNVEKDSLMLVDDKGEALDFIYTVGQGDEMPGIDGIKIKKADIRAALIAQFKAKVKE